MKQAVCLALGADVKTELDRLARSQERSRSWLANHAIQQFLERNRVASEPLIADANSARAKSYTDLMRKAP